MLFCLAKQNTLEFSGIWPSTYLFNNAGKIFVIDKLPVEPIIVISNSCISEFGCIINSICNFILILNEKNKNKIK